MTDLRPAEAWDDWQHSSLISLTDAGSALLNAAADISFSFWSVWSETGTVVVRGESVSLSGS